MLVLRVESEEVEKLREELGLPKNEMYDMHMTLCVKEETAREVAVEELGVEKVLAVEEVARKEAVEREENGLVELVRRMDVGKVDGS